MQYYIHSDAAHFAFTEHVSDQTLFIPNNLSKFYSVLYPLSRMLVYFMSNYSNNYAENFAYLRSQ